MEHKAILNRLLSWYSNTSAAGGSGEQPSLPNSTRSAALPVLSPNTGGQQPLKLRALTNASLVKFALQRPSLPIKDILRAVRYFKVFWTGEFCCYFVFKHFNSIAQWERSGQLAIFFGITFINTVRCYSVSPQLEREMPMKPEILSYLYQHCLKIHFLSIKFLYRESCLKTSIL